MSWPKKPKTLKGCQAHIEGLAAKRKELVDDQEREADLKFQLEYVDREIENLAQEVDEATVKGIPAEMERVADEFNEVPDTAAGTLPVLTDLFEKARELEVSFHSLSNARQNALSRLGKTEGMNLDVGLGKLSQVPSPPGFTFRAPGELHTLVAALETCRQKLADHEKFKEANPKFQEEIEA